MLLYVRKVQLSAEFGHRLFWAVRAFERRVPLTSDRIDRMRRQDVATGQHLWRIVLTSLLFCHRASKNRVKKKLWPELELNRHRLGRGQIGDRGPCLRQSGLRNPRELQQLR
jgi:hypothetical protein